MVTIGRSILFKLKTLNVQSSRNALVAVSHVFRNRSTHFTNCKTFSTNISIEESNHDELESIVKEISNGDPVVENKLRVLMLEVEVMKQDGRQAPDVSFIKKKHWECLLQFQSKNQRSKYLMYLFKTSKAEENKKLQKAEKRKTAMEAIELSKDDPPLPMSQDYSLSGNSMFLRIYESSMKKLYGRKLIQAIMYGQKIVVDCSYNKFMNRKEGQNAAKQLIHLFSENKYHQDPYDLHLCNVDKESDCIKQLYSYIPTIEEPDFPLTLHEESYLDIFPKDKIVYLTPHCKTDLKYSHDDIYVIGCMVDKANSQPHSLAKAKELGLRMARLPLDSYLSWKPGSGKSLTLNQVCSILLDVKLSGDWNYSLRHVPRRKIYNPEDGEEFKIDNAVDIYLKKKPPQEREFPKVSNSRTCVSEELPNSTLKRKVYKKRFVATLFED